MAPRPNTPETFWARVDIRGTDECWDWLGCRDPDGYGVVRFGGRNERAHRVAFWLDKRKPLAEEAVCHACDRPSCCNPAHLFAADNATNTRDRHVKGRSASGERQGLAKLSAALVRSIRERVKRGATQTSIARELGVTQATISQIVLRKTWDHI